VIANRHRRMERLTVLHGNRRVRCRLCASERASGELVNEASARRKRQAKRADGKLPVWQFVNVSYHEFPLVSLV
jgi:hypothetical protein